MTIIQVNNLIYNYFLSNDHLSIDKFITDNSLIVEDKAVLEKIIESALEDLVKADICRKLHFKFELEIDGKLRPEFRTIYVLTQPLNMLAQKIEIPYDLGVMLANELNDFAIKWREANADGEKVNDAQLKLAKAGDLSINDLYYAAAALKVLNTQFDKLLK